jgi:alkanesulfonate monooxygenase SsuD/methylene tetrahydromethanopterin reductase-like flavin-dependent oxidoreductase (luciferase family)
VRYGIAIDLHAPASGAEEVAWSRIRELVVAAEQRGFCLVVLPDHLSYHEGDGSEGYSVPDEPVGVREAMTLAAAAAASTSTIGIGHSVVNAPYRSPAMVAHLAATIADISGGRYSLGIGVGNSYDYDQLGVPADHRTARFEECVEIVASLLRTGSADLDGTYWRADRAVLAFRPDPACRPAIVVAAGGPRSMRVAARHGDAWNGWIPTDPDGDAVRRLVDLLERSCRDVDRDPSTIRRTADLAIDPLDLHGARSRSVAVLGLLRELGFDEVRGYTAAPSSHAGRVEALEAYAALVAEL